MANQYGLSRDIPEAVKREVRQRCGFGCIFDGRMIVEYEHFDPPYADATVHSADGITLLCGDCHNQKTKGLLTADEVSKRNGAPFARAAGFSHFFQRVADGPVHVTLGNIACQDTPAILSVYGLELFRIDRPERLGAPYQVSATFLDDNSNPLLRIDRNEIRSAPAAWDIVQQSNRFEVRSGAADLSLVLRIENQAELVIDRIQMRFGDFAIEHLPGGPTYVRNGSVVVQVAEMSFEGANAAITVEDNGAIAFGRGGSMTFSGIV